MTLAAAPSRVEYFAVTPTSAAVYAHLVAACPPPGTFTRPGPLKATLCDVVKAVAG